MSELASCPHCNRPPGTKTGPPAMARCITPDCEGTKLAAYTFAEWNTHAAPPSTETPRHTSSALTVTRGQPYCAWCNRIGHPATVECQRAYYAGQERKEFTARMMSNLDGEKDAQIATLTSSLAAAARIGELEKQIRAALKIVGDPASGHRMMSGRRDACAVWKLLSAALSQTEEGQS